MSQSEREAIQSERRELEDTLNELEGYGKGTQAEQIDAHRIKSEIQRLDNAVSARTPKEVRGVQKDKLMAEEKEIEDALKVGMPTWFEMRKPSMNPGAVRKHMNWLVRNNPRIERYREIQRILRPMNPKSIESLREEK